MRLKLINSYLLELSQMIFKEIADGLNKKIVPQRILQDFLHFCLGLCCQDGSFFLEEDADTVEGQNFEGLSAYYTIEDEEKLVRADVVNKAVENPREN